MTTSIARRSWFELRPLVPRLAGTLGSGAGIALFSIVSGVVLARQLGPAGRGELARLLLWPSVISGFGNLGIDLAASYFSADPAVRQRVPATVLRIAARQSVVVSALYLAAVPFIFDGRTYGFLPFLMTLYIPADLVALYAASCLNGRLDARAFNIARVSMGPIYAAALGVFAVAGALTPTTAALAFLASNAILAVIALEMLRRRHGFGQHDRALSAKAWRFGRRAHFGRLTPTGLGLDIVLVSLLLSSRDLGLFVAASAFLSAPRLLATSVGLVVFPQASTTRRSGETPRLRAMILLTVFVSGVGAVALALLARPLLVALFGERFAPAAVVLQLLAVGEIARTAYALIIEALRGSGRPGLTSAAEGISWALFLSVVSAGALAGGLTGTAAGVCAATVAALAVLLVITWSSGSLSWIFASADGPVGHVRRS